MKSQVEDLQQITKFKIIWNLRIKIPKWTWWLDLKAMAIRELSSEREPNIIQECQWGRIAPTQGDSRQLMSHFSKTLTVKITIRGSLRNTKKMRMNSWAAVSITIMTRISLDLYILPTFNNSSWYKTLSKWFQSRQDPSMSNNKSMRDK